MNSVKSSTVSAQSMNTRCSGSGIARDEAGC